MSTDNANTRKRQSEGWNRSCQISSAIVGSVPIIKKLMTKVIENALDIKADRGA